MRRATRLRQGSGLACLVRQGYGGQGPVSAVQVAEHRRLVALARDRRAFVGISPYRGRVAPVLAKYAGKVQRHGEPTRLARFAAVSDRLTAAPRGLVRVAQEPQGHGAERQATDPRDVPGRVGQRNTATSMSITLLVWSSIVGVICATGVPGGIPACGQSRGHKSNIGC